MSEAELRRELEGCRRAAFGWALHCCGGDRDEALGLLQTSYLKVLDGRARFRAESSLQTWLFALIRNTALDQRRSWWRLFQSKCEIEDRPSESEVMLDERASEVERAIATLPQRQREVLHLVFYQELTLATAAQFMGVSVGSARTHYERAKAKLRPLLREYQTVRV